MHCSISGVVCIVQIGIETGAECDITKCSACSTCTTVLDQLVDASLDI